MCVCVIYVCILIDLQRASFGNKNSDSLAQAGVLPRRVGKVAMLWARERERWRKREKGKTWHSSVKSASFVCFLSLSFRNENHLGIKKNSEVFGFQSVRRLLKSLGRFWKWRYIIIQSSLVWAQLFLKKSSQYLSYTYGIYGICIFYV